MSAMFDIGPLTWVKAEIDSSLERARAALRAYIANPANAAHLKACQTHLHQAYGAVQIVGLEGVSCFFEQAEHLLSDIESGAVQPERPVLELAERAISAIAKYLSELVDGAPDQPVKLYPEYRLLAEARRAPTPGEADLYFPNLTLVPPPRGKPPVRVPRDEADGFLRGLRARFQRGLVRWLREPSDVAAVRDMRAVVDAIEEIQLIPAQRSFWWAAGAFYDALEWGDLSVVPGVKQLVGRIEQQLRRMSYGSSSVADRMLREVLYWVASAGNGSERVRAVKQAFKLEGTLPGAERAPESPQRAAAALAIREAVVGAKDGWTRFSAGVEGALSAFAKHAGVIAEQGRLIGSDAIAALAAEIGRVAPVFEAEPAKLSEAAAMEVATALLILESAALRYENEPPDLGRQVKVMLERLAAVVFGAQTGAALPTTGLVDEMTRHAQERLATGAALVEIQSNLQRIEQVLDVYFRDPTKAGDLASVDSVLRQIIGALRVLGEEEACSALERCAAKIREFSKTSARPPLNEFEEIAQLLSGLSFYVESLRHGKADFATAMRPLGERSGAPPEETKLEESMEEAESASSNATPQRVSLPEPLPLEPAAAGSGGSEEVDQELLVIFLEEAHTVLSALAENLGVCRAQPSSAPHLTSIRRGFHTLKGSGRMVGLLKLGEAAWAIEQVMNLWLQEERSATPDLLDLIDQAQATFKDWVRRIEAGEPQPDGEALIAAAERVKRGEPLGTSARTVTETEPVRPAAPTPAAPGPRPAPAADAEMVVVGDSRISASLFAVFVREAGQFLEALERELASAATAQRVGDELIRASHTFGGICGTVQIEPMHKLGHALEAALMGLRKRGTPPHAAELRLLAYCVGALRAMYTDAVAKRAPRSRDDLIKSLDTLKSLQNAAPSAPEDEASDPGATAEPAQDAHQTPGAQAADPAGEVQAAHETSEPDVSASPAPDDLSFTFDAIETKTPLQNGPAAEAGSGVSLDSLLSDDFGAANRSETASSEADFPLLDESLTGPGASDAAASLASDPAQDRGELSFSLDDLVPAPEPATPLARPITPAPAQAGAEPSADRRQRRIEDDIDPQLLPVFLEEAQELVPQAGDLIRAWKKDPANVELGSALQRVLHTFKGGARMAGVMSLGELTHHMEARVEHALALKSTPAQLFDDLEESFDRANILMERLQRPDAEPVESAEPAEAVTPEVAAATAVLREGVATRAMLRVQAETLEKLVNRAGEVAIARSRIETEVRALKVALTELTDNVSRLRGQLREIEIQAESQMQARVREVEEREKAFDPLEFDRFTRFQELTRMMAESVNDVATLQQSIMRTIDGSDAALSIQARLNRELQQDLMRVRMVPVGSIADRLHRLVRQTAKELEKRANLDIRGANVELDRSVLERVTGPLEHLLRNSLTHGIEAPAVRIARGKPEFGEIRLDVRQEGNEIVLLLSDDGGGLDLTKIRKRAVERQLIVPEEKIDDQHLAELIFLPGFSTAEKVTEVAGRGVGMDVVREEVRALGGRVGIENMPGRGVQFSVRLPLTTAVTQAVLVKSGTRICALPAVMVEQVRQLLPRQLERMRTEGHAEWAGRTYPFAYLPALLGEQGGPGVEAGSRAPVLLVRLGNETVALHVDEIVGNQEVVVKNLGPQLARVPGVTGITVLGTGEIVLILNPIPLLSLPRVETHAPVEAAEAGQPSRPKVVVVDDSLTVRKITGRLLAREGFDVVTAKDGVEALELIEHLVPDAMLVDIEMPRMDGFDLTRNVRADKRLKNVPIIMITSRSAEKHRAYAMEVGVDAFLGKPYREDELLGHIGRLVRREPALTA